jgi:hypothetical protein
LLTRIFVNSDPFCDITRRARHVRFRGLLVTLPRWAATRIPSHTPAVIPKSSALTISCFVIRPTQPGSILRPHLVPRMLEGSLFPSKTCGQWLGMAFVRIVVRDHTDGGTGETRMGMEDERRDPCSGRPASRLHSSQTPPRRCLRELATRDSVRLAESVSPWHVSPSWTIEEGARMAAVRAHHIFR